MDRAAPRRLRLLHLLRFIMRSRPVPERLWRSDGRHVRDMRRGKLHRLIRQVSLYTSVASHETVRTSPAPGGLWCCYDITEGEYFRICHGYEGI